MRLEITKLCKTYGNKTALKDFSFSFSEGIYGILGANGAGKSTLMNLITDNVKRDSGQILYNGEDVLSLGDSFRAVLGYMPQQQHLYEKMTVESFLTYMARLKGIPGKKIREELDKVTEKTNLKKIRHDRNDTLSGGMKQRVLLAQALLGDPQVLILDEPTAGLDPKERERLREYISELSKDRIVLLATHIVTDIEAIADQILLMKEGRLLKAESPEDLKASLPADYVPLLQHVSLEDVYLYYLGEEHHE